MLLLPLRSANAETYLLVANTASTAGGFRVMLLFEDDTAALEKTFSAPPNSRTNVYGRSVSDL